MGTFHHDKHALHGITVIVDTLGSKVFVGRCDDIDESVVVLLDGDVHDESQGGRSKQDWIQEAARYGVWKKFARVSIPRAEVASVTRLGDITLEA